MENDLIEDEEDEDDYGDHDHDLLNGDEWEDNKEALKIVASMPKSWSLVKVVNFTHRSTSEMSKWLEDNCTGKYKRVGFHSGCSYNVGVQFENSSDAIMFKLRWSR